MFMHGIVVCEFIGVRCGTVEASVLGCGTTSLGGFSGTSRPLKNDTATMSPDVGHQSPSDAVPYSRREETR